MSTKTGRLIKTQRERKALSQAELATLAGISRSSVYAAESGDPTSPRTRGKIARALDLKPEDLYDKSDYEDEPSVVNRVA